MRRIPVSPREADIAVLALPRVLGALLPVTVTSDGLILGEQVHFLGFPYGLGLPGVLRDDGAPFPLVKHAIVAGFGPAGEGYLRFSYANSVENIQIALERVRTALAKL